LAERRGGWSLVLVGEKTQFGRGETISELSRRKEDSEREREEGMKGDPFPLQLFFSP